RGWTASSGRRESAVSDGFPGAPDAETEVSFSGAEADPEMPYNVPDASWKAPPDTPVGEPEASESVRRGSGEDGSEAAPVTAPEARALETVPEAWAAPETVSKARAAPETVSKARAALETAPAISESSGTGGVPPA